MKHKALSVLKTLLQGNTFEHDGYKYQLSEDDKLCIVSRYVSGGVTSERLLVPDISFNYFLKICSEVSDKEASMLNADTALNDYLSASRKDRGRK